MPQPQTKTRTRTQTIKAEVFVIANTKKGTILSHPCITKFSADAKLADFRTFYPKESEPCVVVAATVVAHVPLPPAKAGKKKGGGK